MKCQMISGLVSIKFLIAFGSLLALMYGCHALHSSSRPRIQFYPVSDSNLNHSLINGSLAIDSNNHTFIYSFVDGLILNNSKRVYKDSILVAWHGETYYQSKPLRYNEIDLGVFDNIDVAFDNFLFYYGKRNCNFIKHARITNQRDTSVSSYNRHRTQQFVFFSKSDIIKSVTSLSDSQDTIFNYSNNGKLKKVYIRKTKSMKFNKVTDDLTEEALKKYDKSNYWNEILDSFNTDYSLPILESNRNTLLSK